MGGGGEAPSLKHCTTQLPLLIESIDLFDTMWFYEAGPFRVRVSKRTLNKHHSNPKVRLFFQRRATVEKKLKRKN